MRDWTPLAIGAVLGGLLKWQLDQLMARHKDDQLEQQLTAIETKLHHFKAEQTELQTLRQQLSEAETKISQLQDLLQPIQPPKPHQADERWRWATVVVLFLFVGSALTYFTFFWEPSTPIVIGQTITSADSVPTMAINDSPEFNEAWASANPDITERVETSSTACAISSPLFVELSTEQQTALGCPTAAIITDTTITEQRFKGGLMLGRDDTAEIYTVYNEGTWATDSAWDWSNVELAQRDAGGVGLDSPAGMLEPTGEFGWVWRTFLDGADGQLGWAIYPRRSFNDTVQLQPFDNGLILQLDPSQRYVLLNDGRVLAY